MGVDEVGEPCAGSGRTALAGRRDREARGTVDGERVMVAPGGPREKIPELANWRNEP